MGIVLPGSSKLSNTTTMIRSLLFLAVVAAAMFAVSAEPEPEAKPEAGPQNYYSSGYYNNYNRYYPQFYRGYNNYNGYNGYYNNYNNFRYGYPNYYSNNFYRYFW